MGFSIANNNENPWAIYPPEEDLFGLTALPAAGPEYPIADPWGDYYSPGSPTAGPEYTAALQNVHGATEEDAYGGNDYSAGSLAAPPTRNYDSSRSTGSAPAWLPTQPLNDPYLSMIQPLMTNYLDPNYAAYSPEVLQTRKAAKADELLRNIFLPTESRLAARFAGSGGSGSGLARLGWEGLSDEEKRMIAAENRAIDEEALAKTDTNVARAMGMIPGISSLWTANQTLPVDYQLTWEQIQNGINQANAQGTGNFLGSLMTFIPALLGAL